MTEQYASDIIIVTGYSGAGKSTVLAALQDYGFFCIDNLPYELLAPFFYGVTNSLHHQKIALGIDVRSGSNLELFAQELIKWREHCGKKMRIIFLTASDAILIKRFQETRRKHPLGDDKTLPEAIKLEQVLLAPFKALAHEVIDTDQLTMYQLRFLMKNIGEQPQQPQMMVTLTSFGFKYGTPRDCNFVYDVRSLPNPYFVPSLKELDGRSERIQTYLFEQPLVQNYWQKFITFFTFSLEQSYQEGRFFMHIGIGCTGGKHRSVAFVERCAQLSLPMVKFFIHHKDIAATQTYEYESSL